MQKIILQNSHKLPFPDLLNDISHSLRDAQNRIYATHLLATEGDFVLPQEYCDALLCSHCIDRKRIVFGNKDLFSVFSQSEKYGFTNLYTQRSDYQRMLLIDATAYFRYGDIFYRTTDLSDIQRFLEYFQSIHTI